MRRLVGKLAAHPFSPRTALQSRDCLRVRVRRGCTAIFPPSALFPGISRRCTWRSVASVRAQRRPSVAQVPEDASCTRACTPLGLEWNTSSYANRRTFAAHYASRHLSALGSPVALLLALSRYQSCHSRFLLAALPRLRAAQSAASCAKNSLKVYNCT